MDKNNSNRFLNFFKKEGFYVLLFVCLCIVAVVAVMSTNSAKIRRTASNKPTVTPTVVSSNRTSTQEAVAQPTIQPDNALQVKNSADAGSTAQKTTPTQAQTAAVSKTVDTTFVKPVEGTLARAFSLDPVYWDSTSTWRANLGEDIKCDLGRPVVAVLDGTVEQINLDSQDGVQVVIAHQNGLKTVYSNLDANVSVKKDQVVKKGDQIGKVGKTTIRAAYEKYGTHLHFQVLSGKDYVDPAKYIKY